MHAVDGVDLHINRGETLGVVGESGCGKSVTAMTIMKLLAMPPGFIAGGEILFEGRDLVKATNAEMRTIRSREIAMIFQEPMTSLNPLHTVERQIGEILDVHQGVKGEAARARIIDLLSK
ncbi:MAG: ATP-binding cassette domain-containing protein, partial [Burkholderiaceae bacterium]